MRHLINHRRLRNKRETHHPEHSRIVELTSIAEQEENRHNRLFFTAVSRCAREISDSKWNSDNVSKIAVESWTQQNIVSDSTLITNIQ